MRIAIIVLSLSTACLAQPCIIASQHQYKFGENISRIKPHKPFDYVEGDYPKKIKFQSELNEKTIRNVQEAGGKVIVIKPNYSAEELEGARERCGFATH